MQVMLNIPDKIPQAVINKLVLQFEEQIQAIALDVSQTESQKTKLSKRQAGLGERAIWMSDDFDKSLEFSEANYSEVKSLLAELKGINEIEPLEMEEITRADRINPCLDDVL